MLGWFSRSWMSPGIIFTHQQALEARMSQVEKRAISLRETNPYLNQAGFGSATISSSQQCNQAINDNQAQSQVGLAILPPCQFSFPHPGNVSPILITETLSRQCYKCIKKAGKWFVECQANEDVVQI